MRSPARFFAVLLVAAYVLLPVAAQAMPHVFPFTQAETEGDEPVVEQPTFAPGEEPAVVAPPATPEERDEPWTARLLAPVLLFGVLVVTAGFFTVYTARVRGKYEVVD